MCGGGVTVDWRVVVPPVSLDLAVSPAKQIPEVGLVLCAACRSGEARGDGRCQN